MDVLFSQLFYFSDKAQDCFISHGRQGSIVLTKMVRFDCLGIPQGFPMLACLALSGAFGIEFSFILTKISFEVTKVCIWSGCIFAWKHNCNIGEGHPKC